MGGAAGATVSTGIRLPWVGDPGPEAARARACGRRQCPGADSCLGWDCSSGDDGCGMWRVSGSGRKGDGVRASAGLLPTFLMSGSDLRGDGERSLFVRDPVGSSTRRGCFPAAWVRDCVRFVYCHRHVAGAPDRSWAGSGKSFGANSTKVPNLAPCITSLVALGKLLHQLCTLAASLERGCNTATLLVSGEGQRYTQMA